MTTTQLKVYLAGPMESAGGNWNLPLFDYAAERMRAQGWDVFNPAELLRATSGSLQELLDQDPELRKMLRQQALKTELNWIMDHAQLVMLLPGWERSPGAKAEYALAVALGIETRETGTIILPTEKSAGQSSTLDLSEPV